MINAHRTRRKRSPQGWGGLCTRIVEPMVGCVWRRRVGRTGLGRQVGEACALGGLAPGLSGRLERRCLASGRGPHRIATGCRPPACQGRSTQPRPSSGSRSIHPESIIVGIALSECRITRCGRDTGRSRLVRRRSMGSRRAGCHRRGGGRAVHGPCRRSTHRHRRCGLQQRAAPRRPHRQS